MSNSNHFPLLPPPAHGRNWLHRAGLALVTGAVIVLGFFFLTIALIAGALLATFIALRIWWVMRKFRAAQAAAAPLEGEYTVAERCGPDLPRG